MRNDAIAIAVVHSLAQLTGHPVHEISETDNLVEDLGVDSFLSVNLLLEVEDRLKSRLPEGCEGSFVDIRTVGELIERFELAFAMDGNTHDGLCKARAMAT
jgi:acyl carrier protein